ncbi:dockerin type I domain-containing protein [Stieleria sp. ICT_E10.1]|uniref:dockerin type I domain-containing protein n=1 Tax=Stieleria sedimenti TaxID=2976331 RepID=UPI0021809AC3|nr:dockerin type I domain-containing protein [Stieleria sedimenti]MCS7468224.1 dockerin type I domain-containing protein [Stieleria sedimenti]
MQHLKPLAVEVLERRCMLAAWLVELPAVGNVSAIAQLSADRSVCVAYQGPTGSGTITLRRTTDAALETTIDEIGGDGETGVPLAIHDAVFKKDGPLSLAGSAETQRSIPGGGGEPVEWIDRVPTPRGLAETVVGNSGTFHAVAADGRLVGEDDLLPIVFENGETFALPLPDGDAIGSANDLNEDRIVGYANDDAILWTVEQGQWHPTVLQHRSSDSFGAANSISSYGIVGGVLLRAPDEGTAAEEVAVLWDRNGAVLREFVVEGGSSVTHVIDYLAAIETSDGTLIYDPNQRTVAELGEKLLAFGLPNVPTGPLRLTDLELSGDGEQILILFESGGNGETRQYAAGVGVSELGIGGQHPWDRHDVNNDGQVTPLDALFVINRLSRDASDTLPTPRKFDEPFYDVTGDDRVTPLDALHVLNHLQRRGP